MACATEEPEEAPDGFMGPAVLSLFDVETKQRRVITTHGSDVETVAMDDSRQVIVTGDSVGTVRVGRADGSKPHLLLGPSGVVKDVALSSDGEWVAAAVASQIWLWPMPDLDKPPLHTLPQEDLLTKLDTLTNLRVVENDTAPTGYRVDIGPFPGWQEVPEW